MPDSNIRKHYENGFVFGMATLTKKHLTTH